MYKNSAKVNGAFLNEALVPNAFGRLLNEMMTEAFQPEKETKLRPSADLGETESQYFIDLSLPGLSKEAISIELEERMLKVSGTYPKVEEEGAKYHLRERRTGDFARNFRLPQNANADTVSATYNNGVLRITIDKVQPERKNIEVK